MKINKLMHSSLAKTAFVVLALGSVGVAQSATYTVFSWGDGQLNGTGATAGGVKDLPPQPTAANTPSSLVYDGSSNTRGRAQVTNSSAAPVPTNMTMTITALNYVSGGLRRYQINARNATSGSTTGAPTYGYQTSTSEFGFAIPGATSEAELDFGSTAGISYKFEFDFASPVNNPSFFLMDIDNETSDKISNIFASGLNGVSYPILSIPQGSLITYTGSGPSLVLSTSPTTGNSEDNEFLGNAFLEWSGSGITHLEFTYSTTVRTSIRMSNIFAEYDPVNTDGSRYTIAVVPEPTTAALAGLFGLFGLTRRRRS